MPFPSGSISVRDASYEDVTSGKQWFMPHANDVQFLKVRGVIIIGDVPLSYKFTLVKYDLSIDEIPWVLFSTLNDALYKEFKEDFFTTLNVDRKDRWDFEKVAWLDGPKQYDVDYPYSDIWMSIFEPSGATSREKRPFVYNDDHLRVHRNGAAVYSEEKKLIFLLPLIVQTHRLLPDKPLFWANDNSPLSLYKTYTWMHEDTIKWLAKTGADYPPALRPQIQPRIEALRTGQYGRRQPPPPPQPNRWQPKSIQMQRNTESQVPPAPQSLAVRLSPRNMVAPDKMYMVLQEGFMDMASQLPRTKRRGNPSTASQAKDAVMSPDSSSQEPPAATAKKEKRGKTNVTRVEAGKQATRRPATPPPRADARKPDKRSKNSPAKEMPKEKEQEQESSSSDSSSSSSSSSEAPEAPQEEEEPDQPEEEETQKKEDEEEEEEGQSSEESDTPDLTEKAIKKADLPTLDKMQRAAEKRIGVLETDLKTTKDFLSAIIKRRKTVKKGSRDADMERMD